MSKHWNDEVIELERQYVDNLTGGQVVAMERWDLQWEINRLQKIIERRDAEIGSLRFDLVMLKAELNAIRGRRNEQS